MPDRDDEQGRPRPDASAAERAAPRRANRSRAASAAQEQVPYGPVELAHRARFAHDTGRGEQDPARLSYQRFIEAARLRRLAESDEPEEVATLDIGARIRRVT